jgi:hypothetical protein
MVPEKILYLLIFNSVCDTQQKLILAKSFFTFSKMGYRNDRTILLLLLKAERGNQVLLQLAALGKKNI